MPLELSSDSSMLKNFSGLLKRLDCDDVLNNMNDIIHKLVDTEEVKQLLENKNVGDDSINNFVEVLSSIKLLLEMYENSFRNNIVTAHLTVDEILQSVREVLDIAVQENDFPENFPIHLILDIVSTTYSIVSLTPDDQNIHELANFYQYNLYMLKVNFAAEQHSQSRITKELSIRLRILSAILGSLLKIESESTSLVYENFKSSFLSRIKENNVPDSIRDNTLFSKLVIRNSETIATLTVLCVIPKYVKFFKNIFVFQSVWDEISGLISDESEVNNYARCFLVICSLFDLNFNQLKGCNKENSTHSIFEDEKYWTFIQKGLVNSDSMVRKQALYLFKSSIEEIKENNNNISCQKKDELNVCNFDKKLNDGIVPLKNGIKNFMISNNKIFLVHNDNVNVMWWDSHLKDELYDIYKNVFLVIECLEEKQAHIIKPIFDFIENIIKLCKVPFSNGNVINISWLIVIFERLIAHDNLTVVKWGVTNLLRLSIDLFLNEKMMTGVVQLLIKSLNNTNLYSSDCNLLQKELENFFKQSSSAKSSVKFFKMFIKEMNAVTWSSESLFYLIDALAKTPKSFFWSEKEVAILREFILNAMRTHYTYIRCGIQCRLLSAIINLTDTSNMKLEVIASLLGSFCSSESLQRGTKVWNEVVSWIEYCYSKKSAEDFILKFLEYDSNKILNDKCIAKMIVLLHDAHLFGIMKCCGETPSCRIINAIANILAPFKDFNKRLYSNKMEMDYYLSLFCHILTENLSMKNPEKTRLVEIMLRFFQDINAYIQSQLEMIKHLGEFHSCQLYLLMFENILKAQNLFKVDPTNLINGLYVKLLNNLKISSTGGQNLAEPSKSSVQRYIQMKLLKIIIENVYNNKAVPNIRSFQSYFKCSINCSLEKTDSDLNLTRDLNVVWGKMNSEYLEIKWCLLERLKNENLVTISNGTMDVKKFIDNAQLVTFCMQAFEICGYTVLLPVMSVLKDVLIDLEEDMSTEVILKVAEAAWNLTFERRKTEGFWLSMEKFIEMLFQGEIISKKDPAVTEALVKYSEKIFSEPINGLANIFIKHIQQLGVRYSLSPFYAEALASALLFGPLQRKDAKLTSDVCCYIESLDICSQSSNWNRSCEVRARAVQILLTLDPAVESHKTFATSVAEALIAKEKNICSNKSRYFGDSYIHRVKNRLLQTLLLLEPMMSQESVESLSRWLVNNMITENQQPSVRYQQEWLLVRILYRYPHLQASFWDNFNEALEKRVGSLCSFISVVYHISKIIPNNLIVAWVERAVGQFLPYCMAQHFSVRLYAQVTLQKLWELAKERNLREVTDEYGVISNCLVRSIENGNAVKNSVKLQEDFYFTIFHPLEHYTLQTIFMDLPGLANLSADEWITVDLFKNCGVTNVKGRIPLETNNQSLASHSASKWLLKTSHERFEENDEGIDSRTSNIQKKMIPLKAVIPDYSELLDSHQELTRRKGTLTKDGLIVVASLIDKVPNLGGLGRTCEVFGVSEYVLGSLKYAEDKQFQSLSVTAEKWLPLTEVKPYYLAEYLTTMKEKGYVVLGAEQTAKSKPLHEVKFPKKSILLLGNEKEGIPVELIPLLDICIEIPQLGVIRSLNVHVTGALFVWEYAKQHSLLSQ